MFRYTGNYINLLETENGNLKIELTAKGKDELSNRTISHCKLAGVYQDKEDFRCDECRALVELAFQDSHREILEDLFESIRCNSSHEIISPEEIGALTDAPIIALDVQRDDDGIFQNAAKVFWFERYQVESELENLLRDGFVIFQNAEVN